MLASDRPTWEPWDEEAYAAVLGYDVRPAADALTLVLALRHVNVRLLASMSPELWNRTAMHPTQGAVDVAGWVRIADEHLALHVLQARRAVIGMV
jgi:hypothetical protein